MERAWLDRVKDFGYNFKEDKFQMRKSFELVNRILKNALNCTVIHDPRERSMLPAADEHCCLHTIRKIVKQQQLAIVYNI